MNCTETQKNIEALLDGELSEHEKEAAEHHLWLCPPCLELREQAASLSKLLQTAAVAAPPAELERRLIKSFQQHHAPVKPAWQRVFFGGLIVPKPIFATLLIVAAAALWLAFQIGKISSSTVSINAPEIVVNQVPPPETKIQTVTIEVPVIREKIVTRTIYVSKRKNNQTGTENNKSPGISRQNNLPLYSSTVAENNYLTDVSLKGFEPSAEIGWKIIKGVKEDEK